MYYRRLTDEERSSREETVRRLHAVGLNWNEIGQKIGVSAVTAARIGYGLQLCLDTDTHRSRRAEKVRASSSSPQVRAAMSAAARHRSAMKLLTPSQRNDYALLRKVAGLSLPQAMRLIGRADLVGGEA